MYIFYHVYCNKYTMPILKDQITRIIFSGLYEAVTSVKCFLAGDLKADIDEVEAFLKDCGEKFTIEEKGEGDRTFERFTLTKIPKYITDADKFLYIHTKGVSEKNNTGDNNQNVYWWRTWMEYHLIHRYEFCLKQLDEHDIVGVGYTTKMIGPHFSGNFWWSTGAYFKRLSREHSIGEFYTDPEVYIFKGLPNFAMADDNSIHDRYCLYKNPMFPKLYMDKPVN